MLTLRDHANGYFRASMSTLSDSARDGWIAERYVGVFARAYSEPLKLFAAADTSSPVQAIVRDWSPHLYPVTACKGRWLRVRSPTKGTRHEGWMAPRMQCADAYTTCN